MNADTIKLLDQLNALESIAHGRLDAFRETQGNLASRVSVAPGIFGPSGNDSPLLKQLELEIVQEGDVAAAITMYIAEIKNWLLNDPTFSALGINGPPAPAIPQKIVDYFASIVAVLSPGAPAIFSPLPTPTPAVTVKPGAPAGANSPWGYI